MWIIRLLLPAALLVVIIAFAFLNPGQKVEVELLFAYYRDIPLAIVVLFSILSGMLLMFTLSVFHDLKIRGQVRRLRQENRKLSGELTTLRTSPFHDEDPGEESLR